MIENIVIKGIGIMNLKEYIADADLVLVGIGEKFQDKFENIKVRDEKNLTIFEEFSRKKYLDDCDDDVMEAYRKLERLIEGKNYFIVTLCNDDKIFKTNIKPERIVAPCGSYQWLQCEDVCTEDIYFMGDYEQILMNGEEPKCPHCGKNLIVNRLGCKKYSEEGYLKKWNLYTKWLQGTLNKKVCILELGVGMKYPTVIRWPFERVAFINEKAKFLRVHEFLYQLTEEIKEKGISLETNPIELLRNQIV